MMTAMTAAKMRKNMKNVSKDYVKDFQKILDCIGIEDKYKFKDEIENIKNLCSLIHEDKIRIIEFEQED